MFADNGLVSIWVPLVFIARGVIVDTIRSSNAVAHGVEPFSLMRSPFGKFIVASKLMRVLYAVVKGIAFAGLALREPFQQWLPEIWQYLQLADHDPHVPLRLSVRAPVHRARRTRDRRVRLRAAARHPQTARSEAMRLAIFDVDGTLVRGSSERLFWRYLAARGRQGPRQIAAYLLFLVRYLPTGGIHTLKKNKAYLCGLERADVAALAAEFVATRLVPRLRERGRATAPSARAARRRGRAAHGHDRAHRSSARASARCALRLRDALQRAQRPLSRSAAGDAPVRRREARSRTAARGADRLRAQERDAAYGDSRHDSSCSKP